VGLGRSPSSELGRGTGGACTAGAGAAELPGGAAGHVVLTVLAGGVVERGRGRSSPAAWLAAGRCSPRLPPRRPMEELRTASAGSTLEVEDEQKLWLAPSDHVVIDII